MKPQQTTRLQNILADSGIASRRHSAELIKLGKVTVNGKTVTEPGLRVDPGKDTVQYLNKPIPRHSQPRTIVLYKPRGYICSTNTTQGRTVYELIKDIPERLVPVGRIDKDSEGLLLMSNDGDLVYELTHPKFEKEKIYRVTVSGKVDVTTLDKLRSRMIIDSYTIQPARVELHDRNSKTGRCTLIFTLKEGRNRQIRKMCDQVNLKVHRLVRTSVCGITLGRLECGKWRNITKAEETILRK